jgi:nicotinate dehydrogenase subunit A
MVAFPEAAYLSEPWRQRADVSRLYAYAQVTTAAGEDVIPNNGERRSHLVDAASDTPLLYVLRNDLGLNGPKFGCGLGQCGACAAIVGGKLTKTCSIALEDVGEKKVITLEGLGTVDKLHPLQKSFIEEQAAQCGYCSNGMILAAKALLDCNPNPGETEIRNALEDQLCRCGVHNRVVHAVRRAAAELAR